MRIKSFLWGFTILTLVFYGCSEEKITENSENKTKIEFNRADYNDGRNIDFSIFQYYGEDFVNELRNLVYSPITRAGGYPTGIYDILINSVTGEVLPEGETFSIMIDSDGSNYGSIWIKASHYLTQDFDSIQLTPSSPMGTIHIPGYWNSNPYNFRTILWEYKYGTQGWVPFNIFSQFPGDISFTSNLDTLNNTVSKLGQNITIYKTGVYPTVIPETVVFRAVDKDLEVLTGINTLGQTVRSVAVLQMPTTTSLTIPIPPLAENTTENRGFTLQWAIRDAATGDTAAWTTFGHGIQLGQLDPFVIKRATVSGLYAHESQITVNLYSENDYAEGALIRAYTDYHRYLPYPAALDSVVAFAAPSGADYSGVATLTIPAVGPLDGWNANYYTNIGFHGTFGGARWIIQYHNGREWVDITTTIYQNEYWLSVSNRESSIAANNGTWEIRVFGSFKAGTVLLSAGDATTYDLYSPAIACANPEGSVNGIVHKMNIVNNTGTERDIYLWYKVEGDTGGNNGWRRWDSSNQQTSGWTGNTPIKQLAP